MPGHRSFGRRWPHLEYVIDDLVARHLQARAVGRLETGRPECGARVRFGAIVIRAIRLEDPGRDGPPDRLAGSEKGRRAFARATAHRDEGEGLDGRSHADQVAEGAFQLEAPAGPGVPPPAFAPV